MQQHKKLYMWVISTRPLPASALTVKRASRLMWTWDCRMIAQIALVLTSSLPYSHFSLLSFGFMSIFCYLSCFFHLLPWKLSDCFSPIYPLGFSLCLFSFLPFSLCGQGVGLEPSREERLSSTQANICPALNWANMDKANTISFSVPSCVPCCPFIPFLSFLSCCRAYCWSTKAHTMHRFFFKQITGWRINLITEFVYGLCLFTNISM